MEQRKKNKQTGKQKSQYLSPDLHLDLPIGNEADKKQIGEPGQEQWKKNTTRANIGKVTQVEW